MISNFLKHTCSLLACGTFSAAIAVVIAVTGVLLVDAVGGRFGNVTPQVAAVQAGSMR